MLARPSHRLWCDEGAIVLALMNQRLGFQTRLVDLLDAKTGISHHTTLQVKQAGHWVTFDFTSRRSGIPLSATVPYQAVPRYRPYPATPLHWFLQYNGFARDLVRQLRASPNEELKTQTCIEDSNPVKLAIPGYKFSHTIFHWRIWFEAGPSL